jgi:hypothetical protein
MGVLDECRWNFFGGMSFINKVPPRKDKSRSPDGGGVFFFVLYRDRWISRRFPEFPNL